MTTENDPSPKEDAPPPATISRVPLHHVRSDIAARDPDSLINPLARQIVDALNEERVRKGLAPFKK